MGKEAYIGVSDIARKIKKMYISLADNTPYVEYLSSNAVEYINTGIATKAGIRIEVTLSINELNYNHALLGNHYNPLPCSLLITTQNKFQAVIAGNVITSSKIAELNTIYKIVFYIGSQNQYVMINNEKIIESAYSISSTASNILLFKRNSSSENGCKIKIYTCKIYDNGTLVRKFIPVLNKSNIPCFYNTTTSSYFTNQGSGTFGYGNVGENIIGVARKVLKGYIGVNGIAKQFYGNVEYNNFSSSIFPRSWSGGNKNANSIFTGSNSYGSWKISANKDTTGSGYYASKAFDGTDSSYYRTDGSVDVIIYIEFPQGIYINPSIIKYRGTDYKSSTSIQRKI